MCMWSSAGSDIRYSNIGDDTGMGMECPVEYQTLLHNVQDIEYKYGFLE